MSIGVTEGGERREHPVPEGCRQTCYLCWRLVADVGEVYYVWEMNYNLCVEHKDATGRQGAFSHLFKTRPLNPSDAARKITKSHYERPNRRKPEPQKLVVKSVDEELNEGEVIDEVAAFLRQMGKNV